MKMINKQNKFVPALLAVILFAAFGANAAGTQGQGFETLAGGIKARTLKAGNGPVAEPGMVATIHLIGWLDEAGVRGKELYNSRRDGDTVAFVIGTDRVMPAWNAGVTGMQAGETRMLLVPPAMAWGERGVQGRVPANAAVMLQIELVRLERPESD